MIREADLSDFDAVSVLENQVFNMHLTARPDILKENQQLFNYEYFEKCLKDESRKIFVFEENALVLGHCMTRQWEYKNHPLILDMKVLEIDDLCVEETERGRQIGRRLFEHTKAYAKEIGAAHLELTVWSFNKNARSFYEHLGMTEKTVRMELDIKQ